MPTTLDQVEKMGRKKKGEGEETPTVTVKIDRVLAGRARIVANEKGVDVAQYLSDLLKPQVTKDWRKIVESMDE